VGPKGLALRFACLLVFLRAANQHDIDYWVGGKWHDKLTADVRFFIGCVTALWVYGPHKKIFYLIVATIFLGAVLIGGWFAFHHGTPRGPLDLELIERRDAIRRIVERGNEK
jgi:hypothetical protein